MKRGILFLLLCLACGWANIYGQVAINEDGNPPDESAILDLQSANKGLLLPRIDFNDRPDPAAPGLLIYVTANGPNGNNALYLFDGTSWLKLAYTTSIAIGQQTEGGVVFWLDTSGVHGLVSSMADLDWDEWGCFGELIGPDAQHTGIGSGDTNTAAIIATCTDDWIAAYRCDTLTNNGYTDWYLPSRDELYEMYVQKNAIGGFISGWYWTSTEAAEAEPPEEGAWIVDFTDGSDWWTSKSNTEPIRCIRKF